MHASNNMVTSERTEVLYIELISYMLVYNFGFSLWFFIILGAFVNRSVYSVFNTSIPFKI